MRVILPAIFVAVLLWTCQGRSPYRYVCNKPFDVLFIVDTSSSIWSGNYDSVKTFLKSVIGMFNIGLQENHTRVGIVTYSKEAHLEFHLNTYETLQEIQDAVENITFHTGETYTHLALNFASEVLSNRLYGSRAEVPKIAVLLTDGESTYPETTATAASNLKAKGVHVFAIGVGEKLVYNELNIIATPPRQKNVFKVTDIDALYRIEVALAQACCRVSSLGRTPFTKKPVAPIPTGTTETTEEKPICDDDPPVPNECDAKTADIYLLLDASTSVSTFTFEEQVLTFVRSLVSSFEISPFHTRIGLVTFSDRVNHEFNLSKYDSLRPLFDRIHSKHIEYLTGLTNTGDAIDYVVTHGFGNGQSREGVTQSIVVVTDGQSQLTKKTAAAAASAREKSIIMFAVGVGLDIDMNELADIANDPDQKYILFVENPSTPSSIYQLLAQKTCKVSTTKSRSTRHIPQCSELHSNVMFVYDYINLIPTSKTVVQNLISDFIQDAVVSAPYIKAGIQTQPCVGGVTTLQNMGQFRESVANIVKGYNMEYSTVVDLLRTGQFQQSSKSEQRVAVIVVDYTTKNLNRLLSEITSLKFSDVKVITVVVGNVDNSFLENLAYLPSSDHLLSINSYNDMIHTKLDILGLLCDKN